MRVDNDELAGPSSASSSSSSAPARRKLRIFKEPSSNSSISQIIWTPKSSPQLPKTSVESAGEAPAIFFASGAPQPKLSNVSCASLPLPGGETRRQQHFSPVSAKSTHSLLHDAPPIYETGGSLCELDSRRIDDEPSQSSFSASQDDCGSDTLEATTYSESFHPNRVSGEDRNTCGPSGENNFDGSTLRRSHSRNKAEAGKSDTACRASLDSSNGEKRNQTFKKANHTEMLNKSARPLSSIFQPNHTISVFVEKSSPAVTEYRSPVEECLTGSSTSLQKYEELHMQNNNVQSDDENQQNFNKNLSARLNKSDTRCASCSTLNNCGTISTGGRRRASVGELLFADDDDLRVFAVELAKRPLPLPKEKIFCDKTFRSQTPSEEASVSIEIDEKTAKIEQHVKAIGINSMSSASSSVTEDQDENTLDRPRHHIAGEPSVSLSLNESLSPSGTTFFTESFNTVAETSTGTFEFGSAVDESPLSLSSLTPAPMFKCIRRLTVGIVQLRDFSVISFDDAQLSASVKLDSEEVFQSAPVPATANCTFGVETSCDLPAEFNAVHVILTQMAGGQRVSCPIGRVSVSRRELIDASERLADVWLPIVRIVGAPCTEILGNICVDTQFHASTRILSVQIIDYTIWQRAPKSDKHENNNNNQQNTVRQYSSGGTLRRGASATEAPVGDALEYLASVEQLYARMCVSAGRARYSPMKKLRIVERRAVEVVHLNCGQLLAKKTSTSSAGSASTTASTTPSEASATAKKAVLSPPPRPPPPRLPPNYAQKVAASAQKPLGSSSFDALEQELQLSRSGSGGAKNRPKARSRLLSSTASVSRSNNSVTAVPAENPLHADGKPARKPRTSKSTNADDVSASTPNRPNGWQSTSSIPDNYSYSTSAGEPKKQQHHQQQQKSDQQQETRCSPLKLRLNIKLYADAGHDESSYCGYVRVPLDEATMLPKDQPLGPNWFNIKSRSTIVGGSTCGDETSATTAAAHPPVHAATAGAAGGSKMGRRAAAATGAPHDAERRFVASLDTPPLHFRHASTPSKSDGGTAPTEIKSLRSMGSLRGSALSVADSNMVDGDINYHIMSSTAKSTVSTSKPVVHVDNNAFSVTSSARLTTVATSAERVGEMRLRLRYSVDEILPLVHYQPLYTNLINSLSIKPYSASLTSILQYLPINVGNIARPLMKIFVHANQIRAFLRLTCAQYVSSCQADVNTLFRSHSLASKIVCELMDFIGQDYLIVTLKPLIDLIYAERKCCEIDPSKMRPGDTIDHNMRNLIVYAELAFSRVIDSRRRCPRVLREVFAELRATVAERFSGREDVARLAVSSFLMLRYFSAAILHPKHFALRQDAPEAVVSRTLVLISKILQRLANCVVSAHPLFTKEEWLTPIMQRFLDEPHKRAMTRFLDAVSSFSAASDANDASDSDEAEIDVAVGSSLATDRPSCCCEPAADIGALAAAVNANNHSGSESGLSLSCHELGHSHRHRMPALLKHGHMIERRCGSDKKKSFKNLIHQKRRYVTLTETQLSWQKASSGSVADLHHSSLQQHRAGCTAVATPPRKTDAKAVRHNSLHHALAPEPRAGTTPSGGQHKGHFVLSEITSVSPLTEAKNSFRVVTPHSEVHFQASSVGEMNEWLILIQKQQRRHIMLLNRSSSEAPRIDSSTRPTVMSLHSADGEVDTVDMEREMQIVHVRLLEQVETLRQWRAWIDLEHAAILRGASVAPSGGAIPLPIDQIFSGVTTTGEREICLARLHETIVSTIAAVQQIEDAHQTARNLAYQMKALRQQNKNKSVADNNVVFLPTRQQQQLQQLQKEVNKPKKVQADAENTPIVLTRPGSAAGGQRAKSNARRIAVD